MDIYRVLWIINRVRLFHCSLDEKEKWENEYNMGPYIRGQSYKDKKQHIKEIYFKTEDKRGLWLGDMRMSTECLWWWLSSAGPPAAWTWAARPRSGSGTRGCRRRLLWSSWTVWGRVRRQRVAYHTAGHRGWPHSSRYPPLGPHTTWQRCE